MNQVQKNQVQAQVEFHAKQKKNVEVSLDLGRGVVFPPIIVFPGVLRPDVMTSLALARFLHENPKLYRGTCAVDVACGCGVQGIVMRVFGAARVFLTDLYDVPVANALENMENFRFDGEPLTCCFLRQGDLLEPVAGMRPKCIVANLPFFPDKPDEAVPITAAFMDSGEMIHRFFKQAAQWMHPRGVVVMPYFDLAGPKNDPRLQGPEHGFSVEVAESFDSGTGLQRGEVSISSLRLS